MEQSWHRQRALSILGADMTAGRLLSRIASIVAMAGAIVSLDCGGSDLSTPSLTAEFSPSATATAAGRVKLVEAGRAGTRVVLNVVLYGPTASSDLDAFAFDLVIADTTVARFVPGTASAGNALLLSAGQSIDLYAQQSGGRVVVGIRKTGGGGGNGVSVAQATVVSLAFDVLRVGGTALTLAGSPTNPQNPTPTAAAFDPSGNKIGSVEFDSAPATLSGV